MGEIIVFVGMALFSLFIFIMKEKVKKQELAALEKRKKEQAEMKKRERPSPSFHDLSQTRPKSRPSWAGRRDDAYEIKEKKCGG